MFYRFVRAVGWVVMHLFFRFRITGLENIPKEGAFLLCANHISAFDPIVLAVFTKRQLRFMAKKELFKRRLFSWFLRSMGAFPIDRKAAADMQAYRTSMELLKNGEGMIIFSQGTRMKDFDNAKGGVALFALKSGAPIIPTGIWSKYRFMSKIHINVGSAISMDEHEGKKVKTELIEEVMSTVIERVSQLTK